MKINIKKQLSQLLSLVIKSKSTREKFKQILCPFYLTRQNNIMLNQIQMKMSLTNDVFRFNDLKFFVPNYPLEAIQNNIVTTRNFYEYNILKILDLYLPANCHILDIGANIGNHSIYWATRSKASKIVAFEPIYETFKILEKNIEINNLGSIITPFNFAIGEKEALASIEFFNTENHGATSLAISENGKIKVVSLDDFLINEEHFEFVKIDVEGFEEHVLRGGEKTFLKNKPFIFIEIHKNNYSRISNLLMSFNAKLIKKFDDYNYLFKIS